jgi:hypothetical protein
MKGKTHLGERRIRYRSCNSAGLRESRSSLCLFLPYLAGQDNGQENSIHVAWVRPAAFCDIQQYKIREEI